MQTKFSARATLLSPQKKLRLKQWISNDSLENPVATASSEDVDTVDAYLDFVDLSLADQIHKKDSEALAFKEQVLLSRIRLPTTPPFKFDVDLSDAPDKSHGSARARTRISQSRKLGTTLELAHRFALHDLLDIAKGLPETSQLVFFDLSARVGIDRPSLALSDFTLLDVAVRNPIDAFQQKPSWSLAIGATRVLDERCIDCVVGGINSNFGYTFKVFRSNRIWFYGLVGPAFELSSGFEAFAHLLVAPTAGIRFKINSATIALLESRFKLGLLTKFEDLQTTATLRSSLQAWFAEVRFETSRYEDRAAAGFGLYY
ncbi:MAG: hypothetical protein EOP05_04895 [Proteobacteria bacterium]|nr:MAG: hypothetical protein EOP05_04895 [Pseudomonadota bacterium]